MTAVMTISRRRFCKGGPRLVSLREGMGVGSPRAASGRIYGVRIVSILPHLRAVLLDLDGTLVDSAEDLREALNELLSREGLRMVDPAEVRSMIGDGALNPAERGLERTGGDGRRAHELLPQFLENYDPRASRKTLPYPGFVE